MIEDVIFSLGEDVSGVVTELMQREYKPFNGGPEYDLDGFDKIPQNAVFVGDDPVKVQQAKEKGFLTCLVHADASSTKREFTGFDMEVENPEDILDVLKTRINVREATVEDLDDAWKVMQSAMPTEYPDWKKELTKRFYRQLYIEPDFSALYVAELDGKIVGYVNYNPRQLTGTFELMQIGVRKDLHGNGIGSALLLQSRAAYIKKMQELGLPIFTVLLTTTKDNEAGESLYLRTNFRRNGEIINAYVGLGNEEFSFGFIYDPTKKYMGEYKITKKVTK